MTAPAFRRARAADAECLARLHAQCFDRPWDADSFVRLLARPGALGLIAFIGIGPDSCSPCGFVLFDQVTEEAEVFTLGVDPVYRGRGVGAALLARGLEVLTLQGVRVVHLEVAVDNLPALALYRSAGFTLSGRRPAYYRRHTGRPSADGLTLSCRLDPSPGR